MDVALTFESLARAAGSNASKFSKSVPSATGSSCPVSVRSMAPPVVYDGI